MGAKLTNKTRSYCEKLNSYEHLQNFVEAGAPVPLVPPSIYVVETNHQTFQLRYPSKVMLIRTFCNVWKIHPRAAMHMHILVMYMYLKITLSDTKVLIVIVVYHTTYSLYLQQNYIGTLANYWQITKAFSLKFT